MMKKYLMTGMAAVALCGIMTGCSNEMDDALTLEESITKIYEDAFIQRFGQPAADLDWGFHNVGQASQARTRGSYPNGNLWEEEGWNIPPELTSGQKERVYKYFQSNTPIGYSDPGWSNFWIQQVYKGGTDANNSYSKTKEEYQSANGGWVVGSNHMDRLAAVGDGIFDHIYNFNNGNCTDWGGRMLMTNSTTKNFGYYNSDGSLGHTDYTGLVSWTVIEAWGEANGVGSSLNDGWNRSFMGFDFEQVVGDDVYAKNNGNIIYAKYSEAPETPQYVWDGTNVLPLTSTGGVADRDITSRFNSCWGENESVVNNNNGSIVYTATEWKGLTAGYKEEDLSQYSKLIVEFEEATEVGTQLWVNVGTNENNWNLTEYVDAGATRIEMDITAADRKYAFGLVRQIAIQAADETTLKIRKIYLKGQEGVTGTGEYMVYNSKQVPYLSSDQNTYCGDYKEYTSDDDVKIRKQYNGQEVVCLNLKKLVDERLSQGYLPVAGSNMKKWVKVQGGADGYYSDWIVTLCEAKKDGDPDDPDNPDDPDDPEDPETPEIPTNAVVRIIAEDLTVDENSDFDFNDVVFDVAPNGDGTTTIILRAAGGTLPLYVAGHEVHQEFAKAYPSKNITTTTMINTRGFTVDPVSFTISGTYDRATSINIPITVTKNGTTVTLTANKGKTASKVAVGTDYQWCNERQDIDNKYHKRNGYRLFTGYVRGEVGDNWYQLVND